MKNRRVDRLGLLLMIVYLTIALSVVLIGAARAEVEPHMSDGMWRQELREQYPGGLPWATLNGEKVNFRDGPGLEYRVVANWSARIAVEVIREHDGWYQVLHWTNPEPMWVWGEYLAFQE